MTEQGVVNDEVPERYFILAQRRKGAKKTPERGNRRTDEQGISNFEVPERYLLTTNGHE